MQAHTVQPCHSPSQSSAAGQLCQSMHLFLRLRVRAQPAGTADVFVSELIKLSHCRRVKLEASVCKHGLGPARNYKVQSTGGLKQWYLLSVFIGDAVRDVPLCKHLAKRMPCPGAGPLPPPQPR
ncbi:uncharacterized protein LOC6582920 isoform X2 [Drosophila mojavensis]|uniref:uncharacterized protein LOC6582920 isoform X2 n=1 Tax=Drosophila mojavensis TaxID=7230 RepID=UPI001CD0D60B|nr:uncharacterized protein LOC6582920 isoform X2 [Drosophila mojavensis]